MTWGRLGKGGVKTGTVTNDEDLGSCPPGDPEESVQGSRIRLNPNRCGWGRRDRKSGAVRSDEGPDRPVLSRTTGPSGVSSAVL